MAELRLNDGEQSLFRDTSATMKFVGVFWIVLGALVFVTNALGAVQGTASYAHGNGTLRVLLALADGVLTAALGVFTMRAARRLRHVARTTEGDAAPALMSAFADLAHMFTVWAVSVGVDLITDVIELRTK